MNTLIVFAKEPRPGAVKTRLGRALGDEAAAKLYAAFLDDTLAVCRTVDAELCVSYTPASAAGWFGALAPDAVLMPQPEGDLGTRLNAAVESAFLIGATGVVVVGSDLPQLETADLERALRAVEMNRAAVGPTRDGGYWLLGLPRPAPEVFSGVDWSTQRVLGQTLDRLAAEEFEVMRLTTRFDVDDAADLERLKAMLEKLPPERCPATRVALSLTA